MPNQRKKNKVALGGWYDKELKKELTAMAKARGITRSQLMEEILEAAVKNHRRHHGADGG